MSFATKRDRMAAGAVVCEPRRASIVFLKRETCAADAVSAFFQAADGALRRIGENLVRMAELAEQAAGDGDSTRRLLLDKEFQALFAEIDRITEATDCNGARLSGGWFSGRHGGFHISGVPDALWESERAAGGGRPMDAAVFPAAQEQVRQAPGKLSGTVSRKNTIRAYLGALRNKSGNAALELSIRTENLHAAESHISDAVAAMKMTAFVRRRITIQSAVVTLLQAADLSDYSDGASTDSVDSR